MGQRRGTDVKDLSPVPVAIGNRSELELKRKSHRDDGCDVFISLRVMSKSIFIANDRRLEAAGDTRHKHRPKRSTSRSRSLSHDEPQEDSGRRHKKAKSRRNHPDDDPSKDAEAPGNPSAPPGETEEEYDARLEREENERLAAERRRHLERFKQLDDTAPKDGIRFKGKLQITRPLHSATTNWVSGRGRMKFIDPEISQRQS